MAGEYKVTPLDWELRLVMVLFSLGAMRFQHRPGYAEVRAQAFPDVSQQSELSAV